MKSALQLAVRCATALAVAFVTPPARASAVVDPSRAWLAEIELVGPIGGVVLDLGEAGETRLEGALLAHEARMLVVPLPAFGARGAPRVHMDPIADLPSHAHGSARFVRWLEPRSSELELVPPGVRARTRPPVENGVARASAVALWVLAAIACAALGLRSRPRGAAGICIVGALVLVLLPSQRARADAARVTLFDGDAESAIWMRIDAAHERLRVEPPLDDASIECRPSGARLVWRIPLHASTTWELGARGVALDRVTPVRPLERGIERASNRWEEFDETWTRVDGQWQAHGAWPHGAALPAALDERSPPGWLASGLPQGVPVFIGRVRPGADGSSHASFVRLTNIH